MVLVIFNYNAFIDGDAKLDHYTQTLQIPRGSHETQWSLVAVNAVYMHNDKEDFKHLDIQFPQLMTTQNVLYANKSMGNVNLPEEGFRFYAKSNALSHTSENNTQIPDPDSKSRQRPVFGCVSEYPNWDLGSHRIEEESITVIVSAREGNVSSTDYCRLNSFSIILSYE